MESTGHITDLRHRLASIDREGQDPLALISLAEELLRQGAMQEAVSLANFAALLGPDDYRVLRGASGVIAESRQYQRCGELMARAVALEPAHADSRLHYAVILIELREYAMAQAQLEALFTLEPESHLGWRNLSSVYACRGDYNAACEAAERAVALAPANREYAIHLAGQLIVLQRIDETYRLLQQLDQAQPGDAVVARLMSAAAEVAGDSDAAMQHAERAVALAPQHIEYEQHLEHLRKVRGHHFAQRRMHAAFPPSLSVPLSPARRNMEATRSMFRVIVSVLIREARTRFGDTKLGYLWAILEPVSHLALLSVVFAYMHTGTAPIGNSILVYYFSGVLPYLLFTNTIMHLQAGIAANRSLLQIPIVKPLDVLFARALLELITQTAVAIIMLTTFGLFGLSSMPHNVALCAEAMLGVWIMALGIGIFNGVVHHFIRSWEHIFASVTRALYFVSGIFVSPLMMPPPVRDVLVWNPLLQGIDLFREGFYEFYEPNWLNTTYLFAFAFCILAIGLAMERAMRRHTASLV